LQSKSKAKEKKRRGGGGGGERACGSRLFSEFCVVRNCYFAADVAGTSAVAINIYQFDMHAQLV
jgi:hypothetical protein